MVFIPHLAPEDSARHPVSHSQSAIDAVLREMNSLQVHLILASMPGDAALPPWGVGI
jgi:hypothetical protein